MKMKGISFDTKYCEITLEKTSKFISKMLMIENGAEI